MQAVFVKTEALACGQLIVLTFIANDGLAFQRGQDGVAGCTVRGQAGALVKGHQHEFHVVGVDEVEVCNAAVLVRNEIFQFGGLACFENVVHGEVLLFQNDFSIDHAAVRQTAAEHFRRNGQQLAGMQRDSTALSTQKEIAAAFPAQIQGGAIVIFRGDGGAAAQREPGNRYTLAQFCRAGNCHGFPDGTQLGKRKWHLHTAFPRKATGTMLRTARP